MANYMPPWLEQPSYLGPWHKASRFGKILMIAAVVVLVCFSGALIIAIVTAG